MSTRDINTGLHTVAFFCLRQIQRRLTGKRRETCGKGPRVGLEPEPAALSHAALFNSNMTVLENDCEGVTA